MKFLLSSLCVFLLCSPVSLLFAGDPDLEKGIQLYKEKKNYDALGYLEKSLKKEKTGIAFYYRGNVKMNLQDYQEAISSYTEAYQLDYKRTDTLFNIACAYSLSKDYYSTLQTLALNYLKGERNLDRIKKNPDLKSFRNTNFYSLLLEVMEKPNGTPLNNVSDIKNFLKENGYSFIFYEYDTPSPGGISFGTKGHLSIMGGGGFNGAYVGGEWKLSEIGLEFRELGLVDTVTPFGTWVNGGDPSPIIRKENFVEKLGNNSGAAYYFVKKDLSKPWTVIRPNEIIMKSIHLEDVDPNTFDLNKIQIVHRIGKFTVYPNLKQ
ncbi:tetratricopeptide repeat protein [Leptospira johnsonii]|uniref:Uncharacterized protein n=1 Tax=Leptospira johnsonii TaxID=1917820 RepID=A0A2P2D166_9LEPT|nr:hypothetical protein [Leptospira johnsonii]GBF38394.1 hypothetical protein LPTSP1_13850 [Leptospira johnsonii]